MFKRISTEQKQELVSRYYSGESATDICTQAGASGSTFYTWLKPYQTTVTDAGYLVNAAEFVKLQKKVEKLEQKVEVLQTVNCTVSSPLKKKLYELEALHGQYSIHVPCESLKVDRGTQYTSHTFQKLLKSCHITQSFSPSGRPHHNAVMESFFASMKKEELYRTNYHSIGELKKRVEVYIEFYNNERPHATLNYKTPNAHEDLASRRNDTTKKLDTEVQRS